MEVLIFAQVRQLRTGKLAPQALATQSSSLGATGSLGGAATALGLGPDASSLFSAMLHRMPAGSLPGAPSNPLSSKSLLLTRRLRPAA